jgi:hypothetical protein
MKKFDCCVQPDVLLTLRLKTDGLHLTATQLQQGAV